MPGSLHRVVVEVDASQSAVFSKELFGPIVLLIKTRDTDHSIALAREMAEHHGAISSWGLYDIPGCA